MFLTGETHGKSISGPTFVCVPGRGGRRTYMFLHSEYVGDVYFAVLFRADRSGGFSDLRIVIVP